MLASAIPVTRQLHPITGITSDPDRHPIQRLHELLGGHSEVIVMAMTGQESQASRTFSSRSGVGCGSTTMDRPSSR
jgi:hypothetical protein